MRKTQTRLEAAYPGLLPGYFTLTDQPVRKASHAPLAARSDVSCPPFDARKRRFGPRHAARYRRLMQAYLEECAAAVSVLFDYGDAVAVGETVVVTAALSGDVFDRIAALGAALEDFENDDPMEEADSDEDDDADEEDYRDESR